MGLGVTSGEKKDTKDYAGDGLGDVDNRELVC